MARIFTEKAFSEKTLMKNKKYIDGKARAMV